MGAHKVINSHLNFITCCLNVWFECYRVTGMFGWGQQAVGRISSPNRAHSFTFSSVIVTFTSLLILFTVFITKQSILLLGSEVYRTLHCFFFLILGTGHSTARIASSNTVFKPFCVKAEHSRYFTAPTSLAIARPCIMLLCINYVQG